jgi:hypothetical protein
MDHSQNGSAVTHDDMRELRRRKLEIKAAASRYVADRVATMNGRKDPQRLADKWNRKVRVGDLVEFEPFPGAPLEAVVTRTEASVLGGHTAVVWVNGKAGCVAIDCCWPVGE